MLDYLTPPKIGTYLVKNQYPRSQFLMFSSLILAGTSDSLQVYGTFPFSRSLAAFHTHIRASSLFCVLHALFHSPLTEG